jgi:Ras-related protein Rab-5C
LKQDGSELVFKMALIGNSSVGKTSIVQRIIENNFSSSN